MKSIRYFIFIFSIALIYSCEKNVTVEIPEVSDEIVIEGKIETDTFPFVIVSKTLPFFGEISVNDLYNQTITGATVIIDNGTIIDTLDQISPDYGIYFSANIRGEIGKTYKLTVFVEGKTLHSVTTIPNPVKLDSVWWKVQGNHDSLGFCWSHLTDPDTLGNCFQVYTQRINRYLYGDEIGKQKDSTFIAVTGSAFDDKFFNTKSFDFSYARGAFSFSSKEDDNNDERYYYKRGDTIVVKFCSIDRATFEFWRTEDAQVQSNGNPFGSPAPISSNIEGGLGIWAGYAPSLDRIIAQ